MFNAQHAAIAPLRVPRIGSLFLSSAFGTVGMSVGINALAQFMDQKRQLLGAAPTGATVHINTSDVLESGFVSTIACGLIALSSFIFLLPGFLTGPYATRISLRIQSAILGFLTLWLFATILTFTIFFVNRSAQVTVTIGTFVLPDNLVQQIVSQLGASTTYKDIEYLRLPAVLQWFPVLFGLTSTALTFAASRRVATHDIDDTAPPAYPITDSEDMREKEETKEEASVEQREIA